MVGILTLVALLAILVGVSGFELPIGRARQGSEQPLPGVRAVGSEVLLRVGSGAPPGGELAFLAVEPGGGLFVSDARRQSLLRFDATGHLLSEWGPRLGNLVLGEPAGVAASGNAFLLMAAQPLFTILQTNLARSSLGARFHKGINEQHRAIVSAIESRDAKRAEREMRAHLEFLRPHYERTWRHAIRAAEQA